MNEDVCDTYKYTLQHLRLRKIPELYGVSCPRTFLFFGYERGSFLYTIDEDIVAFVEPIDDLEMARKEVALLLNELS